MQPALAKKLARRFGEEATKELLLSTVLHVRQGLERERGRGREMPVLCAGSRTWTEQTCMHEMRVAQDRHCPAKQVT